MDIQLYNTLTKKKEVFVPIESGKVSMYQCGPTVYDTPHIGNYRTFIMDDIIRRVFEYNNYSVTQVMNVTDVDDKTIRRSHEEKVSLHDLTRKYEKLFLSGLNALNIILPHHITRATEYIQTMIDLVEVLIANGTAYKAADGVYIKVSKVKNYGVLANIDLNSISKERIANDEYDKENARDFALWKFTSTLDGDTSWDAPFGRGRPGWHIECSAMSMKILGPTIDIHTGGSDLIFPHHTNEIAQSESATGKKFVHYWLHGGFMNVSDEKMAKSKNNFFKLESLLDNSISPLAFRYWLFTAHYRSQVNFTIDAVKAAQSALIKLLATVSSYPDGGKVIDSARTEFLSYINDDLDMPKAIALVWSIIRNPEYLPEDKRATILDFDRVMGLDIESAPRPSGEAVPALIVALAEAREEARKEKDWVKADAIRSEINDRGYEVDDTSTGVRIIAK